jgi:hypothetical protein
MRKVGALRGFHVPQFRGSAKQLHKLTLAGGGAAFLIHHRPGTAPLTGKAPRRHQSRGSLQAPYFFFSGRGHLHAFVRHVNSQTF